MGNHVASFTVGDHVGVTTLKARRRQSHPWFGPHGAHKKLYFYGSLGSIPLSPRLLETRVLVASGVKCTQGLGIVLYGRDAPGHILHSIFCGCTPKPCHSGVILGQAFRAIFNWDTNSGEVPTARRPARMPSMPRWAGACVVPVCAFVEHALHVNAQLRSIQGIGVTSASSAGLGSRPCIIRYSTFS
eukprot:gene9103-biopygen15222